MASTCSVSINLVNSSFNSTFCGDTAIDINSTLQTQINNVNTVEEFENILYTELIDAKNRQTIQAYPLLRLVYERYLSNNLCTNNSNGYNYQSMENISNLIGNYWVDLIEQFIPSTTIWGSTFVYRNTVFDLPKYQYKANTLWLCEDPSTYFPFSAISSDINVDVVKVDFRTDELPKTTFDSSNFFTCNNNTYCNGVWLMTNHCDSEFIGRVIDDNELKDYCENNLMIEEVPLLITKTVAPICNAFNQTWDATNRIFTQIVKVSDLNLIPITSEYNYDIEPYGNNTNGITFNITKLNTNTLKIDWNIPLSAQDPTLTPCPGFYTNLEVVSLLPLQTQPIWDVSPIIVVTEPEFNCEISRLFITNTELSNG